MISFYEKLSFYIYSLDLLSGTKPLKILNREKNVSLTGLIFTFILIVISIIYGTIVLLEYSKQKNYTLISMEDNSNKISSLLNLGNETAAFLRFYKVSLDENGSQVNDDIPDFSKIFKILVTQYIFYHHTQESEYKEDINLINCTNFLNSNFYKHGVSQQIIEKSFCPPNDKGLKVGSNSIISSTLYFHIKLCNKTEDLNCYTDDEIKEKYESGYLSNIFFEFYQENNIIDNDNYTNPLTTKFIKILYYIDLNYYIKFDSTSNFISYESNDGIIFNDIKKYNGLRYNTFKYDINTRQEIYDKESEIISIGYTIDTDYVLYFKRTYVKLPTVIVEIYGIVKIFFTIGGFIINYSFKNYFSFKLFDEIFSKKYSDTIALKKKRNIFNNSFTQAISNKNLLNVNTVLIDNNNKNKEKKNCQISRTNIVEENKKGKKIRKNYTVINDSIKSNRDDSSRKIINSNFNFNKDSDEQYSKILFKYLGYNKKIKKKFSLWNFICSQFIKTNNEMKIINGIAQIIDKYLSLENLINNGINIDILISDFDKQNNNIDMYDKIVGGDIKEVIKKIKLGKVS